MKIQIHAGRSALAVSPHLEGELIKAGEGSARILRPQLRHSQGVHQPICCCRAKQGRGAQLDSNVLPAQQGLLSHLESRLVKAGEGLMCTSSLKLCCRQGLRRAILRCMAGSTACRCSLG